LVWTQWRTEKFSWRQSNVDLPGYSLATMVLFDGNSRSMLCYLYVCTGWCMTCGQYRRNWLPGSFWSKYFI
jgi:hypothetical protein